MRFLQPVCVALSILVSIPAQATLITLDPLLDISRRAFFDNGTPGFEVVSLEASNLSIVDAGSRANSTGSGAADAFIKVGELFNSVDVSTGLLTGPGAARATAFSSSTFDLVFPRRGFYYIDTIVEVNGRLDIDPGDNGFAFWEIFFEFPSDDRIGDNGIFGASFGSRENPFECLDRGCQFDFALNQGFVGFQVSKTRRIPVTTTIFFDIGVSRATAVPEPNVVFLVVFGLILLVLTRKKAKSTFDRIPSRR